jgi:hypothetical protein
MMEPNKKEEPMFPARTPKQKKHHGAVIGDRPLPPHMRKEAAATHKSNSTSSLYVDSTITSPDIDQVLYWYAALSTFPPDTASINWN